jgi:hypothetical protein
MDLANRTTSTLYGPNNEPLEELPTTVLSHEDAAMLRQYKKFMDRHGFREANYCNACWSKEQHDGMRVHVTDGQIMFKCRCRMLFFQGQTF